MTHNSGPKKTAAHTKPHKTTQNHTTNSTRAACTAELERLDLHMHVHSKQQHTAHTMAMGSGTLASDHLRSGSVLALPL
jgi:hypothetical protein